MSPRQIQEEAVDRGYVDRISGVILLPDALYLWLYGEGVSAAEGDSAFSLRQGTTWSFGISRGHPPLTGQTGKKRPPDLVVSPGVDPTYGSGIKGTQATPAGPADPYSPDDPLGAPEIPDEERKAAFLAKAGSEGLALPGDEVRLFFALQRWGMGSDSWADVERWMGAEPGSIERALRAAGKIT